MNRTRVPLPSGSSRNAASDKLRRAHANRVARPQYLTVYTCTPRPGLGSQDEWAMRTVCMREIVNARQDPRTSHVIYVSCALDCHCAYGSCICFDRPHTVTCILRRQEYPVGSYHFLKRVWLRNGARSRPIARLEFTSSSEALHCHPLCQRPNSPFQDKRPRSFNVFNLRVLPMTDPLCSSERLGNARFAGASWNPHKT